MANRISVILDVATNKAVSGLKGFKQSVAEADGAVGKMKAGAGSAFATIKANAGVAGVAVAGSIGLMAKRSIEAASRLGESVNAVNVTFGPMAAGIKALGEEAAESVGLSNAEFNGLAVQFSSFAQTVAGEKGNVVGTMDELTTRVADFASVMNLDVPNAAAVFQSALAGETEPIRRFGIDLSAATVKTFAYANGFAKVGDELTESQKVQARYALLMEETEKTAGDFANTSDGLANSQRILAAKMEDTAAKVGKDLAPAMAAVTTVLSDLIPVAGTVATGVGKAFVAMTDAAYDFGSGIADMVDALPFVEMQKPIAETLFEQQKLARGTEDLVAEYAEGAPTMDEFAAALRAAGENEHAINLAIIEYRKQLDGANEVTGEAVDVTDELTEAVNRTEAAEEAAAEMIEEVNATYGAQVEAVEAAAEALADLTETMLEAVGQAFNLETATQNLALSYLDYQESVLATTEVVNDSEVSDRDKERALRDLRVQEIGLAEEALATAEAFAQEMGASDGSAASAQFQKEKLQELARSMPELYDEIQVYIDKLNNVPGVIRTRFEITASGATVTPHGDFIGVTGPQALGGHVAPGHSYLVGERGPEVLTMNGSSGGTITPNDKLGGGGHTFNLYSSGPTTLSDISHALALARLSR